MTDLASLVRAPSYYSESWSMKDKHVSCFLCQIAFQGNQEADEGLLLSRRLPAARCKGNNGIKNGHFTSSNEIVRNVHRYMLKMWDERLRGISVAKGPGWQPLSPLSRLSIAESTFWHSPRGCTGPQSEHPLTHQNKWSQNLSSRLQTIRRITEF